MEMCSKHGLFEPLKVSHALGQEANGDTLSDSRDILVCNVHSNICPAELILMTTHNMKIYAKF